MCLCAINQIVEWFYLDWNLMFWSSRQVLIDETYQTSIYLLLEQCPQLCLY